MRKIIALVLSIASVGTLTFAQDQKPLSPKETLTASIDGVETEIVYCRPSARGRKMIGGKEPYGQVWRTGANNATTIEFDKPVKVEGKELPAGKYALFTIPGENEWTIIFNKDHNQWGAYKYKDADDVLRVKVKSGKTSEFVETFTIQPEKDKITLKWENTQVSFNVKKT